MRQPPPAGRRSEARWSRLRVRTWLRPPFGSRSRRRRLPAGELERRLHSRVTATIERQGEGPAMARYLISFPSAAMVVADSEWEAVSRDAHAVIHEARAAGVYVFGGGIDESVPPVLVAADGAVAEGGYPWAPALDGGFTVLELPSREAAVAWAARIAKACRCRQELRVFQFDPESWSHP
jgi:hypothetical protein